MQPDEQQNQSGNLNPGQQPADSAVPQWNPAPAVPSSPESDSVPSPAGSTPSPQVFVSPEQPQPLPPQPMPSAMPDMPPAAQIPPANMPVSGQMPIMPGSSSPDRSKLIRTVIIVVIIIVVAGLGVFGWHELQNKNNKNKTTNDANKAAQSNAASGTTDVSKLASFTFAQPAAADLGGLISSQSVNGLTVFGTSDGQCELGFGKVSQAELPGTTIGDVVSQVIAKAKSAAPGITVTGPNTVAARVLKGSDGKKYSLPTVNYSFTGTQDSASFSSDVTYSISQLSDGSHAVVLLECSDTTANDQSALSARVSTLDPVANAITVQVQ